MKVFYLRDERKFPVACVASERKGDIIRVTVVTHNPLDRYDKNEYKRRAAFRLRGTRQVMQFDVKQGVKLDIVKAIAEDFEIPQRAKEAAYLWLNMHWGPGLNWDVADRINDKIVNILNAEAKKRSFDPRQAVAGQLLALEATLRADSGVPVPAELMATCVAARRSLQSTLIAKPNPPVH